MIRAAVGISDRDNSARAALEAAEQALGGLDGSPPDWCIAFVSPEHRPGLTSLLEALSGRLDTPYVAGCSASGVLTADREVEHGPVLGVLAVASDQLRATPFLFHDEGDRGMTAGLRLAQRFSGSRRSEDLLLVLPDPFHVRPDRLLHSLDALLDGVPVVGGAASGSGNDTFQFCGTESGRSAVAGLRLAGGFRHVIGVTHGCRPLGTPLRVTRSHENLLLELEGRPALDLLRERAPAGLLRNEARALHTLSVGILPDPDDAPVRPDEYLVRNIVTVDPDTGVLAVADTIEEGQHVLFVQREPVAARAHLSRMLERLAASRTGLRYRFGLYFNCLARGRSLYAEAGTDARMLAEAFPDVPLLGFFSSAELGPLHGKNQLFTYTGVLLLVAE